MQSCNNIIILITIKIQAKQNEQENKTPSLNNIHDSILETLPKIKNKSQEAREIIIKHLKEYRQNLNNGINIQMESLVYFILKDIAKIS